MPVRTELLRGVYNEDDPGIRKEGETLVNIYKNPFYSSLSLQEYLNRIITSIEREKENPRILFVDDRVARLLHVCSRNRSVSGLVHFAVNRFIDKDVLEALFPESVPNGIQQVREDLFSLVLKFVNENTKEIKDSYPLDLCRELSDQIYTRLFTGTGVEKLKIDTTSPYADGRLSRFFSSIQRG